MNTELKTIPVKVGEELTVTPVERADKDYFTRINGYVVFLKGVNEEMEGEEVRVRISAVKEKFGFAVFLRYV